MSKPIQIFGKNGDQYEVITSEISSILDKIGDKNVVIVSINGKERTGKSFLLNYFLRYLKYNKLHGKQWIYGVNEENLDEFHWRGGAERDTVGIWMWSEPYNVKDKYGNDVALLLVDTQGNFDEQTTFQECCLIFSLSLLMSTTLILNINRELSESELHFVEYLTKFFIGELHSNEALFQKLVFFIHDWQNEEDFPFGYHDQYPPVVKNYMRRVIAPNSNQCLESQNTRKLILRNFNHVSSYLMQTPGNQVISESFRGQTELLNEDFVDNIAKFVPIMLYSYNIEPKTIGGQILTGNVLKHYLNKWSEVIQKQKIPVAKSLTTATAKVNNLLTFKHSLDLYTTYMIVLIETKPTDQKMCIHHKTAKQNSLDYFANIPNVRLSEFRKTQKLEELSERIEQMFVMLRANNTNRADKEEIEKKLNASNALQVQMKKQIENLQCENSKLQSYNNTYIKFTRAVHVMMVKKSEKIDMEHKKEIADLQCKISYVLNESKTKLVENEKLFKEESDKMRQTMDQQNKKHRKMLADLEESHTQNRDQLIKENNEFIQQNLLELEESLAQLRNEFIKINNQITQQRIKDKEEINLRKKATKKQLEEHRKEIETEFENIKRMIEKERRVNEKKQRKFNELRRDTVTGTANRDNNDDNRQKETFSKVFPEDFREIPSNSDSPVGFGLSGIFKCLLCKRIIEYNKINQL